MLVELPKQNYLLSFTRAERMKLISQIPRHFRHDIVTKLLRSRLGSGQDRNGKIFWALLFARQVPNRCFSGSLCSTECSKLINQFFSETTG